MTSSPPARAARLPHATSRGTPPPLRVLVCAGDGTSITAALGRPGSGAAIETFPVAAPEALPEDLGTHWDALVVDDSGPRWSAQTLLDEIRARGASIPVVVVCAPAHEAAGIGLVESGAADYLASDRLARLPLAVRGAAGKEAITRRLTRDDPEAAGRDELLPVGFHDSPTAFVSVDADGRVAHWNQAAEQLLGWSAADARGRSLTELVGGGEGGARLAGIIAQPPGEHGLRGQSIPMRLLRRDGQRVHLEVGSASRRDALPGALLSLTDVTERWRAEFLKEHQLGFLRALGSPSGEVALTGALEQIGRSVAGIEVKLWEVDPRGAVQVRAAWRASDPDQAMTPSPEDPPPVLVTQAISSRRLSFSEGGPTRLAGESLGVPVLNGDNILGAIEIWAPGFSGFDDAYAAHLIGLGSYLGIHLAQRRSAADFARSLEELNRISAERLRLMRLLVEAHEDERRTIAGDIHDDSLQILAAVGLRLHLIRRRVNDEAAKSSLDAVQQMVTTAVSRLRWLMFNLRPAGLDHGDLLGTIRDRLVQVQQDEGIEYTLTGTEPGALTTATRVTLYRVAQEAIANVVKHASASRVSVSVEERDHGCLMQITDDGAGLGAAAESAPGHLGLPTMRERAEVAGGWLRVEAGATCGTVVTAWVPLLAATRSGPGAGA